MTCIHRRTLVLLLTVFVSGTAAANDVTEAKPSCRQETKRVAVWPTGPKAPPIARFEEREVTVCDAKVSRDGKSIPTA